MYLTYEKYISMGGKENEIPFNLLEFEARKEIDKYTLGRLTELDTQSEEVEMCMYKLIKIIKDNNDNRTIVSENIDGYNVTYNTNTNNIKNIITSYLCTCKLDNGTPILYRGR